MPGLYGLKGSDKNVKVSSVESNGNIQKKESGSYLQVTLKSFRLCLSKQNITKLIHISMASYLWDIGKQYSPGFDAASHLGLYCVLTGVSSKNETKMENNS